MLITVQRDIETPQSLSGYMLLDGVRECFTLEPGRTEPVHPGHPCIPAGKYLVKLTLSPHMGFITPELQNVPGRTAIRIHPANFPSELLGCTAVGTDRPSFSPGPLWWVAHSRVAFDALMVKLRTVTGEIWAEYIDPTLPASAGINV